MIATSTGPVICAMAFSCAADEPVRVPQLRLQRIANEWVVEARYQLNDVEARDGIFAIDTCQQIGQRRDVHDLADDTEQGATVRSFLLIGRLQQVAYRKPSAMGINDFHHLVAGQFGRLEQAEEVRWRQVPGTGKCPSHACDHTRVRVGQALQKFGEVARICQLGQYVHEGEGGLLLAPCEFGDDQGHYGRAQSGQFG